MKKRVRSNQRVGRVHLLLGLRAQSEVEVVVRVVTEAEVVGEGSDNVRRPCGVASLQNCLQRTTGSANEKLDDSTCIGTVEGLC